MRVTHVRFAMLRKTEQFENDRAEAEVELEPGDSIEDAFDLAQRSCVQGLQQSRETDEVPPTVRSSLANHLAVRKTKDLAGSVHRAATARRQQNLQNAVRLLVEIMVVVALTWAANLDDATKRYAMMELS